MNVKKYTCSDLLKFPPPFYESLASFWSGCAGIEPGAGKGVAATPSVITWNAAVMSDEGLEDMIDQLPSRLQTVQFSP